MHARETSGEHVNSSLITCVLVFVVALLLPCKQICGFFFARGRCVSKGGNPGIVNFHRFCFPTEVVGALCGSQWHWGVNVYDLAVIRIRVFFNTMLCLFCYIYPLWVLELLRENNSRERKRWQARRCGWLWLSLSFLQFPGQLVNRCTIMSFENFPHVFVYIGVGWKHCCASVPNIFDLWYPPWCVKIWKCFQ